jgi:hypothetical protein
MAMTIVEGTRVVTGGVDTHLDVHLAAALDDIGGLLDVESFEASPAGNDKLLVWLQSFGPVTRVGVEGTGSYGAGLARFLRAASVEVVEVELALRGSSLSCRALAADAHSSKGHAHDHRHHRRARRHRARRDPSTTSSNGSTPSPSTTSPSFSSLSAAPTPSMTYEQTSPVSSTTCTPSR